MIVRWRRVRPLLDAAEMGPAERVVAGLESFGAVRVPGLRNVATTAHCMHGGTAAARDASCGVLPLKVQAGAPPIAVAYSR